MAHTAHATASERSSSAYPRSARGRGPEALQQTVLYATIAVLLVPPIRHAMERFAKRHVESLKAHVEAENRAIHAKMDHIIKHHPDIPNELEKHHDNNHQRAASRAYCGM